MKRFRSHCDAVRMVCQFRRGPSEGLNYSKSRKRMATITGNSRGWGALATRGRTSYRRLPSQSSQDQPARVAHSRYRQTAVQQELASAREQPILFAPPPRRSRGATGSNPPVSRSVMPPPQPSGRRISRHVQLGLTWHGPHFAPHPIPRERRGPIVSSDLATGNDRHAAGHDPIPTFSDGGPPGT